MASETCSGHLGRLAGAETGGVSSCDERVKSRPAPAEARPTASVPHPAPPAPSEYTTRFLVVALFFFFFFFSSFVCVLCFLFFLPNISSFRAYNIAACFVLLACLFVRSFTLFKFACFYFVRFAFNLLCSLASLVRLVVDCSPYYAPSTYLSLTLSLSLSPFPSRACLRHPPPRHREYISCDHDSRDFSGIHYVPRLLIQKCLKPHRSVFVHIPVRTS